MRFSKSVRFGGAFALGTVVAVTAGSILTASSAWARASSQVAQLVRIESPLGLQGTRGAGANVGIIFVVKDASRRKTDVEVQYGYDRNADGKITEDEYKDATEDRIDLRNTRKNKAPQLYTTAGDIGAVQQFVWKSTSDLPSSRILTTEYALTPQGRLIPDPDNLNSFLFATGPGGTQLLAGVQVRARAFRTAIDPQTGRKKRFNSDWAYSNSFPLNNNDPPSMTIDSIDSNGQAGAPESDENVHIHWTVYDKNSEDFNGNGVLDIADNEDVNGNLLLDPEFVGVAFDYHRVGPGETPATMTPDQLAALAWSPCTRAAKDAAGQTDSLIISPGQPPTGGLPSAPPGVGRHWLFSWDSVFDEGTANAKYVFRARPFDQKGEQGDFAYFSTPMQLDNWKVFNPGSQPASNKFKIEPLVSGRVGHTVTHLTPAINPNDALDRGPDLGNKQLQEILVAGGATSVNGGGTTNLELMSINTFTSETTTASHGAPAALITPRAYHTATRLDDGRVLIIGGFDASGANALSTTEVYDPKTNTITAGPSLTSQRAKHAAVRLSGGDVAVFGGIGVGNAALSSCEIVHVLPAVNSSGDPIDASTWTVTGVAGMAVAQHSLYAVLLPDQTVLVTGGIDQAGNGVTAAQVLDPLHDNDISTPLTKDPNFTTVGSMSTVRKFGSATPLIDGDVLFAGGSGASVLSSMEIYNWQTRQFEAVTTPMQVARAQHTATLLGDGTVMIAGGTSDLSQALPPVIADADVVKIVSRTPANVATPGGTWTIALQPVNGDLNTPRRLAQAAAIDNGRVFIVAGADATATTASLETFTPDRGTNFAPSARIELVLNPASVSEQSWLFGTPIAYRLTDPEQDHARVVVEFIDRSPGGERVWHACTSLAQTIGGDTAEFTSDLATVSVDDQTLSIDPVFKNTIADHLFIWAMQNDTLRPAPASTTGPYNVRVIPSGAVRGTPGESAQISVLFNTKIVPTILPFENITNNRPDDGRTQNNGVPTNNKPAGTLTPYQGGDVRIWVHLRDLDGGAPHTNGNKASLLYEYAVDTDNDGSIDHGEKFVKCTASGDAVDPVNHSHASSTNPQTNLDTYFDSPADSSTGFGDRSAQKGFAHFDWDVVADFGVPLGTLRNIWLRVTPADSNTGLVRVLHNQLSDPTKDVLSIIRHPDSLYLISWGPRKDVATNFQYLTTAVPVNDPIDFVFNGQIDPTSVNGVGATTLPVYGGTTKTSQIRGQYVLVNNPNNTATVTFFPDPQEQINGVSKYLQFDPSTVLFPNADYSERVPGFIPGTLPQSGTTLRPLGGSIANNVFSTYRLIQAIPINSLGTDPQYKFHTAGPTVYADDGGAVSNPPGNQTPLAGTTVLRNFGMTSTGVQFTFTRAIDPATVVSPNITVKISSTTTGGVNPATNPVVPGRWTVQNTQTVVGSTVSSTGTLTFVPLFQMPPTTAPVFLRFAWNNGLKAFNGHSLPTQQYDYTVETYSRVLNTGVVIEPFTNQNQFDTTIGSPIAAWGNEGCAAGTLSGATTGVSVTTPPTGSLPALSVTSGTQTLTLQNNNYSSISISKGATLILDSQTAGATSLTSQTNITVAGTISFRGKDGVHASGYTTTGLVYYSFVGAPASGTRLGGAARNGGGAGGSSPSVPTSSTTYRIDGVDGSNGVGATGTFGGRGLATTETSSSILFRYWYGAGGGAGGGNAYAGLAGGRACTQYSASNGYGAASTPGAAANDVFLSSGMTGGGGGGGGGSVASISMSSYGYPEGGAGGAGAGAVSIVCNGQFNLTASGLIDGRGGNGGQGNHACGSGGGGAGGNLKVVALGIGLATGVNAAIFDGVVDLRGGRGGSHGYMYLDPLVYTNASTEKSARYGGDGSPGRVVALAPNFGSTNEVRVFGQMVLRKVSSLAPTFTGSPTYVAPPALTGGSGFGQAAFNGTVASGTYTVPSGTTEVYWSQLNILSGSVIDLIGSTPLKIYVQGSATIAGTLRLNGNSMTSSSTSTQGTLIQNNDGYTTYPNGNGYFRYGSTLSPSNMTADTTLGTMGMRGNMGGGFGGNGAGGTSSSGGTTGFSSVAYGREGGDGFGPTNPSANIAAGKHLLSSTTGWNSGNGWYHYSGDSGGSGGANATDGEDGWAVYAISALYNYLGSTVTDSTGSGTTSQSGLTTPNFPKRLAQSSTTTSADAVTNTTNAALTTYLTNLAGSGGGGGNPAGDTYYVNAGIGGAAGGGAGSLAILSPTSTLTVADGGEIDARGGDGATPGKAYYWLYNISAFAHSGSGGGSGGTVYLGANNVSIVSPNSSGTGGATFDMRGGMGGGFRSQDTSAGLYGYPEYTSTGAFGGHGGYGRLVVEYITSLNNGVQLTNRWGMEQTLDTTSNTYRTLAGTARFYCPGLVNAGGLVRSKWYDLKSISPIVTNFGPSTVLNSSLTLRLEAAQSLPNAVGSVAGTYGPGYGANTGAPDTGNTTGLFQIGVFTNPPSFPTLSPNVTGWRFLRFDGTFTRTTGATGAPVSIDNMKASWTSDVSYP